jgi:branched-chain amino acid transport system substrate-binding protein
VKISSIRGGKRWAIAALSVLMILMMGLTVCFTACGTSEPEATGPIKIGYVMPFSGPAAFFGPEVLSGLELVLEEAGWTGGGRTIEIIQEDNEGDGEKTITKVKKLIELDKVDVLIGIDSPPSLLPVWDYIVAQEVPLLIATCILDNQPAPHAAIEEHRAPHVFRLRQQERHFNYRFAQWLYKNHGARNVMTLALDMPPGYWAAEGFQNGITDLGGTVVDELYAPPQTMDFAPYLAKVNPDAVDTLWVWHTPSAAVGLVKTFDEYGMKGKVLLTGFDIAPEPVVPEFGESGVGLMVVDQYFWDIDTAINKSFVDAYVAKYGHHPDALGEGGYACGQMLLKALEATGGKTDKETLTDALSDVADEGMTLPRGSITFEDNQAYGPVYVSQIQKTADGYVSRIVHSE